MRDMTYEEKLCAIKAIGGSDVGLFIRRPGDWYVYTGVELKDGCMLQSAGCSGATPEAAVNATWAELTESPKFKYVVVNAYGENRRAVKWNGYMWEDVSEPKVER